MKIYLLRLLAVITLFVGTCCSVQALPLTSGATLREEAPNNALLQYLRAPQAPVSFTLVEQGNVGDSVVKTYRLRSQKWKEIEWHHDVVVVIPKEVKNPEYGLLFIAGSAKLNQYLPVLHNIATKAGTITAVLGDVPNQPLFDGKKEDALIALTFDNFIKTGDSSWPLLFPMVKSGIAGMDALEKISLEETGHQITRFVVTGASKRGWTSWLTGAVDKRVVAIAPMVFDMLNMKEQTDWQKKIYGTQSEKIKEYTDKNLIALLETPQGKVLKEWVDPFEYRALLTLPKLILLGTNDPYWVVDSLQHYFAKLPGEKFVYQVPNGTHSAASDPRAIETLSVWYALIAERKPLPSFSWEWKKGKKEVALSLLTKARDAVVSFWHSSSQDRDFRDDTWLKIEKSVKGFSEKLPLPGAGYEALLGQIDIPTEYGLLHLSTDVKVLPEKIRTSPS